MITHKFRKRVCLVLLVSFYLLFSISCSTVKEDLRGARYWDSGEKTGLDKDIIRFVSNVRLSPGNPDSHYLLACYYQERGNHKEAIEEFGKVLLIDPAYVKAYNGIGVSYDLLGKYAKAIDFYQQALRLYPNLDYVHNNLGYSYLLQGNLDEAITTLRRAVALNGQDKRYHNNLGLAYAEKGEFDLALSEFKIGSDEAKAYYNMAQIYFKRGLFEEAKTHYAAALLVNPSLTIVRTRLEAANTLARIFPQTAQTAKPTDLVIPSQPFSTKESLLAANPVKNSVQEKRGTGQPLNPAEELSRRDPGAQIISRDWKDQKGTDWDRILPTSSIAKDEASANKVSVGKEYEITPILFQSKAEETQAKDLVADTRRGERRDKRENSSGPANVPSPVRSPTASEVVKAARELLGFSTEEKGDVLIFNILADGKVENYNFFKLDSPARLVFDIWKVSTRYPKNSVKIKNRFIKGVRIGHYKDKLRLVFDSLNPALPPYQIDGFDDKLVVSFGNIPGLYVKRKGDLR